MVAVERVTAGSLGAVLPLIAGYQRFYGVTEPDEARNRAFFTRMTAPDGDRGVLLAAADGGEVLGFACVYWTWESVAAADVAVLHDLFVVEAARGRRVGAALIDRAIAEARDRGLPTLSWMTALGNRRAQRLYERYPAEREAWFEYTVDVTRPQWAAGTPS